jgi:hypothetical protein
MLLGLWQKASRGDPASVDRVLRIQERRARLLGLDADPGRNNTSDNAVDTVDFAPAILK